MTHWLRTMFRSALTRAAKIAGYDAATWAALGGGMSLAFASSGMTVTRDAAFKVAAYKRGVQLIADYIGKTPFHVKTGHARATNHPAWHLVRKWARWHELSSFEFRRVLTIHALTTGNGYGWIERDANMQPIKLHILDPRKIGPRILNGRTVYKIDGKDSYFESHEIIHIRGLSVDGYAGMDPITTYATEVLGLALAQQQYATTYFANGGAPSSFATFPGSLDDEQWAKMASRMGPLKRAVDNPHEIPILENGMKLESLNLSAEQTQLLGAREFSLKDIANLLGLPAHKLQGTGNSSYKSLEEENRSFRDDTLDPWLCQFEMEYQKLLTEEQQRTDSHDVEAVRESLTRTNMTDRANILYKNVGGPIMTQNEGREIVSLPPVDGGDVLLQPLNMVDAGEPDPIDPNAEPAAARGAGISDFRSQISNEEFDAQCLTALTDVVSRMTKRITTQATRTKPEQWAEFAGSIDAKHGDVIRSAFAPLLPLCGGAAGTRRADAQPLAERVATHFVKCVRSQLTPETFEQLDARAGTIAGEILTLIRT